MTAWNISVGNKGTMKHLRSCKADSTHVSISTKITRPSDEQKLMTKGSAFAQTQNIPVKAWVYITEPSASQHNRMTSGFSIGNYNQDYTDDTKQYSKTWV